MYSTTTEYNIAITDHVNNKIFTCIRMSMILVV